MKKSTWVVAVLSMVTLLLAAPAVAQQSPYTIRIPFAFNIAGQVLPAGEYRVEMIRPGALQVRGVDTTANAFFSTAFVHRSRGEALNSELVFHRYGSQYFLATVWFEDVGSGYQLFVSKTEREYSSRQQGDTTVLRAAKR